MFRLGLTWQLAVGDEQETARRTFKRCGKGVIKGDPAAAVQPGAGLPGRVDDGDLLVIKQQGVEAS